MWISNNSNNKQDNLSPRARSKASSNKSLQIDKKSEWPPLQQQCKVVQIENWDDSQLS